MKLGYSELRDRIAGCWQGKNAGGALGAPLECKRGKVNVEWYLQPDIERNPPPNDDLDLQIAWLCAVEEYGSGVSANVLADYWLTYVTPNWSEYGIGKSNLRRGIAPPLSGRVGNYFKDSCGCFIRSEIWACLCPGSPRALPTSTAAWTTPTRAFTASCFLPQSNPQRLSSMISTRSSTSACRISRRTVRWRGLSIS